MDIKVGGIILQIMCEVLVQVKEGCLYILGKMVEVLVVLCVEFLFIVLYILSLKINFELIGKVIGFGGKQVCEFEVMGVQVIIEEDGIVCIFSVLGESVEVVKVCIEVVIKEVKVGEEFEGIVVKIVFFGVFVNLFFGQDGMLYIL